MELSPLESITLLALANLGGLGLGIYLVYDGLDRFDRMVEGYCMRRVASRGIVTKPGSNFAKYEPDNTGR